MPRATQWAILVILAGTLTACSNAGVGADADTDAAHDRGTNEHMGDHEHTHEHRGMDELNMGNPHAVPAAQVPGADIASGQFQLLDTAPEGYHNVTGNATIARYVGGTTTTIELVGLAPHTQFISHLHRGQCIDGGGAHYKFDPAGGDLPPNEIHLAFTSTAEGTGYATAENNQTAGPDARSVVVHPRGSTEHRVACAPLS